MSARAVTALACLATLCACPLPSTSAPDAGCAALPEGCALTVAPSCPAGTMPRVGQDGCVPVGWTDCPAGFTAAASGFGCVEVLPSAACSGPTRAALGQTSCLPVGACGAAFPPAEATLFVDAAGPVDATHFKAINDALRAAPAGATIAVAPGTYAESLAFPKPVTLVGRCASMVTVTVLDKPHAGLAVRGTKGVVVSGLAVTRSTHAAQVFGGGELTLRDVVLDANVELGLLSSGDGSLLTLERSVVRGTRPNAGDSGWGGVAELGGSITLRQTELSGNTVLGAAVRGATSRLVVEDSVVASTQEGPSGGMGRGFVVQGGGRLELRGSAVVANHDSGIFVAEGGSTVTVERTVVRATAPLAATGGWGRGITVQEGGAVTLDSVSLTGNHEAAVVVSSTPVSPQSALVATNSVFEGTLPVAGPGAAPQPNVAPQHGGWGLTLERGGRASLSGCALVGNVELGVMAADPGTILSLSATLVASTQGNRDGAYGRGLALQTGAQVQLDGCAVVDNVEVGVDLDGTGGSTARLDSTLVRHTLASAGSGVTGNGVIARGGARLDVNGSVLELNPGPALTFSGSSGTVVASRLSDNGVGLHAQGGSTVSQVQAIPSTVGPLDVVIGADTLFERNQSNQGTGTVALPPGLTPPAP